MSSRSTVILTGAGISAESGLATFRDEDGLWYRHRVEDVGTPEGFHADPERGHAFYNMLRRKLLAGEAAPNAAHRAIARLQQAWPDRVTLITQNIDDLHERAASPAVLHMHGRLLEARCEACGAVVAAHDDMSPASACSACAVTGRMRPHVVWFGEMPFHMPEIARALAGADLFVAIGTSGLVYPAADFVRQARLAGAETVEINLQETANSRIFDRTIAGRASEMVPRFVEGLIGR